MGGLHVATYGQDAVGDAVIRRLRCEDAAVRRLLDAKVTRRRAAGTKVLETIAVPSRSADEINTHSAISRYRRV